MRPHRTLKMILPAIVAFALVIGLAPPALSQVTTTTEICDDAGNGPADIQSLTASFDDAADLITVELQLCANADSQTKYRVHFDAPPFFEPTNPAEPHPDCPTVSDDIMMHKGSKDTGPGLIAVDGNTLTYTVTLAELGLDPSLGDAEVHIWADTQQQGVQDLAPDTDATDTCPEPQEAGEVLTLPLIAVTCPCWDLTQLTADLDTYAAERSVPRSSLECTVVQNDASGIVIAFSPDITTIGPFGAGAVFDPGDEEEGEPATNGCGSHDGFDGPPPPDSREEGITDAELQACRNVVSALATQEECPGF